jgi:hypothetical protein
MVIGEGHGLGSALQRLVGIDHRGLASEHGILPLAPVAVMAIDQATTGGAQFVVAERRIMG